MKLIDSLGNDIARYPEEFFKNNRGRLRNDFYVGYSGVLMKYKDILKVTFAMIPEEIVINYKRYLEEIFCRNRLMDELSRFALMKSFIKHTKKPKK